MENSNLNIVRHPVYGWEVRLDVTGSFADVEAYTNEYFRNYHPAGYGTTVKYINQPDGNVKAEISRSKSCD